MLELGLLQAVTDTSMGGILAIEGRSRGAYLNTSSSGVICIVAICAGQLTVVKQGIQVVVRIAV